MVKISLQKASIACLVVWLGVWVLYLLMRFSPIDIRVIPGIGPFLLLSLAVIFLAPIVAGVLALVAIIRQPRTLLNVLLLACAIAAFVGQYFLFLISRWM